MYELLFSSQQSKVKDFRKHYFNVMFPHISQQLTNKMVEDHQKAIIEIEGGHQLAITDRDNRIKTIQYENVALQVQRNVHQFQLQRCEDAATYLRATYVDHARDLGKEHIIIIVRKHAISANDKYHNLPYYLSRIKRRKTYVKLRWLNQQFPDHQVIK